MSYIHFAPRIALLAGGFVALSVATPAMAGCQSGSSANPPTTNLLNSGDLPSYRDRHQRLGCGQQCSSDGTREHGHWYFTPTLRLHGSTSLGSFSEARDLYATTLGGFAGSHRR